MNYSYQNWNEDKSCFLGENLIIAVRSIQHCSDTDALFCDCDVLMLPTLEIRVHKAQYWAFSVFKSFIKTMTLGVVQTDVYLKHRNKLDCLILEESR